MTDKKTDTGTENFEGRVAPKPQQKLIIVDGNNSLTSEVRKQLEVQQDVMVVDALPTSPVPDMRSMPLPTLLELPPTPAVARAAFNMTPDKLIEPVNEGWVREAAGRAQLGFPRKVSAAGRWLNKADHLYSITQARLGNLIQFTVSTRQHGLARIGITKTGAAMRLAEFLGKSATGFDVNRIEAKLRRPNHSKHSMTFIVVDEG